MGNELNWQRETIELIVKYFNSLGVKYAASKDVYKCLIDFFNTKMKLIDAKPRQVFVSDKIRNGKYQPNVRQALNYIGTKITNGVDITYHFSKRVLDPTYNDLLLNDWLIRHLHLSVTNGKPKQRFYDRTGMVLFAAFSDNQAFFIDIRKHGKDGEDYVFAKQEFLEIIDRNWPHILKEYTAHDVYDVNPQLTDEKVDKYRKAGLTVGMTKVNDKIIINPGIGISTSGHSVHVSMRANEVVRFIQQSLKEVENNEAEIIQALCDETGSQIKELDLCMRYIDEYPFFVVYEKNSERYVYKNYE